MVHETPKQSPFTIYVCHCQKTTTISSRNKENKKQKDDGLNGVGTNEDIYFFNYVNNGQ